MEILYLVFLYLSSIFMGSQDLELNYLFDDFWGWLTEDSPEFSTLVGVKSFEDKLESYSLASYECRVNKVQDFLQRAETFDPNQLLSEESQLNLRLFKEHLNIYIKGYKYKGFLYPVNYIEGPLIDLDTLITTWMDLSSLQQYRSALSRLKEFPRQIDEIIELLQEGVKLNLTNHAASMEGIDGQFAEALKDVKSTALYGKFTSLPANIPASEAEAIRDEAAKLIADHVQPAFRKLQAYISTSYLPHTRQHVGVWNLPQGTEFYQQCLDFHTTTNLTALEIHQMGKREVERIETQMKLIIKEVGSNSSIVEFTESLRNDKKFQCKSGEELVKEFQRINDEEILPRLPNIIKETPKMPLEIKPMPPTHTSGPGAFYIAGTMDGSRSGVFSVNVGIFDKLPKYELKSLALHEGNPGHHLQAAVLLESADIPKFRQGCNDRQYYMAPSRFTFYTAYMEGWGLYSEALGHDLNMYNDPYDRFGYLGMEIFRACRLVVDTGMHALKWTREDAVEYLTQHTALTLTNIQNEVRRYITWPGQACAYKVGEIKLQELRKLSKEALGEKFKLTDFHSVVLGCPGPLSVLEQEIKNYIKREQTA